MSEERKKPRWEGKHYSFFQNRECEYFPCHPGADPERFNCLFCYCPLYMLGPDCGGGFRYTDKGIKDCTACLIPHLPENYGLITGKYSEIAARMRRNPAAAPENDRCQGAKAQDSNCQPGAVLTEPAALAILDDPHLTALNIENANNKEPSPEPVEGGGDWEGGLRKSFGRIVLLACTERGFETMGRAAAALAALLPGAEILQTGHCAYVAGYENGPKLSKVTAEWFHKADAFIFFTAAGIAVRCIAPFVRDKFLDPAVLVADEGGRVVISLMSGHAGGANSLCRELAGALKAESVITTATDGRGLFAVDEFAVHRQLAISDRTRAKEISARLLAGERLKIYLEEVWTEEPAAPYNKEETHAKRMKAERTSAREKIRKDILHYGGGVSLAEERGSADIIISCRRRPQDRENVLYLIPRVVTLGIGCRRGASEEAIRKAVEAMLLSTGVFRQSLAGLASIDLKQNEPGLLAFARAWGLMTAFYSAKELGALPGTFTSSDFVQKITGVDCVCERSALHLAMDRSASQAEDAARLTPEERVSQADDGREPVSGKTSYRGRAMVLERKKSLDGVTAALAICL